MSLLAIVAVAAITLVLAYFLYGGVLARLLRLSDQSPTPAVALGDDRDYVPIERGQLLSQHFSAIAAAGPIVGPILAGTMFGWLPALLWIVIGAIFIGGVHDLTALVASVRHRGQSIAAIVREHMSARSYLLFLAFIWLALVYVVVAFADITAAAFCGPVTLEDGRIVSGGGIATSSLIYIALPVLMGLLLRLTRLRLSVATAIFLPLVGLAIWGGQLAPLQIDAWAGLTPAGAQQFWNIFLLAYCFVASIVPVWLLLQPRGHLGGYFLYLTLIGGVLGLIVGGKTATYPAFLGWSGPKGEALFPMLFILIACGACSGFHAMVASGTTSKQLRRETDAKLIGYGAMLLEALVAVISLSCVMVLTVDSPNLTKGPNVLYATGIGGFLATLGVPATFAVSFALMAFTTFVYDTLDVCTRLGRYVLEELTGWRSRAGRAFATALTTGFPLVFLLSNPIDPATGRLVPAWRVFWNLFGASNQLLAALTLIAVTVWLWQTRRAAWVWVVTGIPAAWMYLISVWELTRMFIGYVQARQLATAVPWVALMLVGLAALMLGEALWLLARNTPRAAPLRAVTATTYGTA